MHEIGHLLGLGHTYDLPALTIMGSESDLSFGQAAEPVFPGDQDIVHGQYLHRPESNDIDLYEFQLTDDGHFLGGDHRLAAGRSEPAGFGAHAVSRQRRRDGPGDQPRVDCAERRLLQQRFLRRRWSSNRAPTTSVSRPVATSITTRRLPIRVRADRSQGNYQLRLNFRPAADEFDRGRHGRGHGR